MAEMHDPTVQATDNPDGQTPDGSTQPNNPPTQNEPETYPRQVVKDLRAESAQYRIKAKELQDKLDAIQRQSEQKLKDEQQWQTLAQQWEAKVKELEPVKANYDSLIATIKTSNDDRIAKLPADMQGLVPDYDDPVKLATWLDANADKLTRPAAPNLGNGAGSGERLPVRPAPDQQTTIRRRTYVQPA